MAAVEKIVNNRLPANKEATVLTKTHLVLRINKSKNVLQNNMVAGVVFCPLPGGL